MVEVTKHKDSTRTFLCCCKECRERLGPNARLFDYERNAPTFFKGEDPTAARCEVRTIDMEAKSYTDDDGHYAFVYLPHNAQVPDVIESLWLGITERIKWREAVGENE